MTPVKSVLNSANKAIINTIELGGDTGTQYLKVTLKYDDTSGNFMYSISELNQKQLRANGGGIDWNTNTDNIPTLTLYQLQPTVKSN